jgi:ubiquinone/menaquinone biosynthesis C-methylase UbiE
VSFAVHDVTRVPFPTEPADVVYARLLLAHLADVEGVVRRWSTMLTIGGSLLADDLEELDAPEPSFRAYLDDVAIAVVRVEGGELFRRSAVPRDGRSARVLEGLRPRRGLLAAAPDQRPGSSR